jgi:hypothetical protein
MGNIFGHHMRRNFVERAIRKEIYHHLAISRYPRIAEETDS